MGVEFTKFDDKTEVDRKAYLNFIESLYSDALKYKPQKKKDFLVLNDLFASFSEMLNSENRVEYEINFNHLGILYLMDKDKDGNFSLDDVEDFAMEILQNVIQVLKKNNEGHLIETQVPAYCTRVLWQEVYGDERLKKRLDQLQNINKSNS